MDSSWLALAEMILVLGGVLGFGVWQLVSVRRARDRAARDGEDAERD
jgi:hypothetical protein